MVVSELNFNSYRLYFVIVLFGGSSPKSAFRFQKACPYATTIGVLFFMTNDDKIQQYTIKLLSIISEGLSEDEQLQEELQEDDGDNLTMFIHALANCVPTMMFNRMTGDDKNNLS